MTINRRTFLGALALLLANRKNVFASSSTNELSEFQKLLNLSINSKSEIDIELNNAINTQLSNNWKGYIFEANQWYGYDRKALIPIYLKTSHGKIIDFTLLCFEKTDTEWLSLPSLSSFHVEGILNISDSIPKNEIRGAVLPIQSKKFVPYGYETESGKFIIKTICNHENNQVHYKIETHQLSIERSITSLKLR